MTMYSCLIVHDLYIYNLLNEVYNVYILCLYLFMQVPEPDNPPRGGKIPKKLMPTNDPNRYRKAPSHFEHSNSKVHSLVVVAGEVKRLQWIEAVTQGHELMIHQKSQFVSH